MNNIVFLKPSGNAEAAAGDVLYRYSKKFSKIHREPSLSASLFDKLY